MEANTMMDKKADWILRIGIAGTFIGHGIFAIGVKAAWFKYFTAVGITESTVHTLLPIIGILDIAVGLSVLVFPMQYVLLWAAIWGFITALIRPIGGDPIWDFVERSANWAAPLALYFLRRKTVKHLPIIGQKEE
ncbi:MAG TPA: hypothetical protein VJJ82_00245 [Candidatus Nanoarchaeia archaeon]|nr:hypothetical protein [Candidatus Nanoarchaeia archaeon]